MKTLLFSYKFLFMTLMALPLSLCSRDNDPKQDFEPVTIDLTGLDITLEDTSFSVGSFQFNVLNAQSNGGVDDGIVLAFGTDDTVSTLELNLGDIGGVSKITLSIFNNGAGSTVVSLWNDENLVEENNDIPWATNEERFKDTTISINDREVDLLRITSLEAIVESIKLE